jgi:hypothetical protein
VQARITAPGTTGSRRIALAAVEGDWGMFAGSFTPRAAGAYELQIDCPDVGHSVTTDMHVSPAVIEKTGRPARFQTLREVSRLTNGTFVHARDLPQVVEAIQLLPEREDIIKRRAFWCSWWWGMIIIVTFCAYLVLRKKWGLL